MADTSGTRNDTPHADNTTRTADSDSQPLSDRVNNRSRRVDHPKFIDYIGSQWLPRPDATVTRGGAADYQPARYAKLGADFKGQRLVIPAGVYKTRSNDTDYRFRAHSAFAHLTGLGGEQEPDAVLVLEPLVDADGARLDNISAPDDVREDSTHKGVLFFKPRAPRGSTEFYADSRYGEFWVGPRPSLAEMETYTGLQCEDIDGLNNWLSKDAGQVGLAIVRNVDAHVENTVQTIREQAGLPTGDDAKKLDERLEVALSELRLIKDDYEVGQLQHAVDITKGGFEEIIKNLPRAAGHHRGERVLEGAFGARAREDGNGLGYDTIVGSGNHACTLHWITNDGPVHPGELVLVDAGVEADSLYTADITRTLPVSGTFSPTQATIYQAVLDACEAGLEQANKPGCLFRDVHDASVKVLVEYLDKWGILPVSPEESLSKDGQQHRRWMPHGVSHHLGLDVHDCAQAAREMYLDAEIKPGMCFTIEPGLYFHRDDAMVPEEFRGIGIRIEDDIIIRPDGTAERLSEDIPRTIADVEAWIADVQSRNK